MKLSLKDIAEITAAEIVSGQADQRVPAGIRKDSREVGDGDVFVCIPGERVDGHEFAAQAVEQGAVAVLAEHIPPNFPKPSPDAPACLLLVENSVRALGQIAAAWRAKTRAKVIGITGSAGKTTVKELVSSILSRVGKVAKNPLNLNNQIGLPMSMLEAVGDEDYWIFEVGISQSHDMSELGPILCPDFAMILNVGPAHVQGLGDTRQVAERKSELLAYVEPNGVGLINADYPELVEEASKVLPHCQYFSCQGASRRYNGEYLGSEPGGLGRYKLWLMGKELEIVLPLRGAYVAENLVAAASVSYACGASLEAIRAGIEDFRPTPQRFEISTLNGLTIIDDSYNANPLSMTASLDGASELAGSRPLVLVLGEMRELGDLSRKEHELLGRKAADTTPQAVFWRGGMGLDFAKGLRASGYTGAFVQVKTAAEFVDAFKKMDIKDGIVLFKASRSIKLEEFKKDLCEELKG